MPADGLVATAKTGLSARPAGSSPIKLHRFSARPEGGLIDIFVAVHESGADVVDGARSQQRAVLG